MNICILGQYPPQLGGIATYTKQLEDKLTSKGHKVYILTYPSNNKHKNNVYEANTINIPGLRGLTFIASSYNKLNKIIEKYNIDIVHANFILPPGLVAALSKRNHDVKFIITVHGSDINILANNHILSKAIKYTLKKADNVYFVSDKLEKKALSLKIEGLKEKSIVTPNTVNINKFQPLDPHSKNELEYKYKHPFVIFIGNLVKQKGLTYLLKAKQLSKTDYTLLIYGDGSEKEKLQSMIIEYNLKDTYLMGKTNTPSKVLPLSDIIVLPSISEGASIVALESMSCGKPLISTDTGNIREVIKNNKNGRIVPPKNPEKLSEAIDELILNKNKRNHMGKLAREFIIKNYSEMKIPYINNDN